MEIKISVVAFWQGVTSKLLNIWMNRKERSKNTVVSLPLLIDKPSIKLTDTCVEHLLRM